MSLISASTAFGWEDTVRSLVKRRGKVDIYDYGLEHQPWHRAVKFRTTPGAIFIRHQPDFLCVPRDRSCDVFFLEAKAGSTITVDAWESYRAMPAPVYLMILDPRDNRIWRGRVDQIGLQDARVQVAKYPKPWDTCGPWFAGGCDARGSKRPYREFDWNTLKLVGRAEELAA